MTNSDEQPLLPRISMGWFFIVVALVAVALILVRFADQGQALATAIIACLIFVILFLFFSAACFAIAYLLGATDQAVAESNPNPENPFSDAGLPEQIIPPKKIDAR